MSEEIPKNTSEKENINRMKYLEKFNVGKYLGEKLSSTYIDKESDFKQIIDDPFEADRLNKIMKMRRISHLSEYNLFRVKESENDRLYRYEWYPIYENICSIRPIPKDSYTLDQIVQHVKEFYEPYDFEYNSKSHNLKDYVKLLFERIPDQSLFVTLSIFSPVYGKDGRKDIKSDEFIVSVGLGKFERSYYKKDPQWDRGPPVLYSGF